MTRNHLALGLVIAFAVFIGIAIGRYYEVWRDRRLNAADREIAGLHALGRIHNPAPEKANASLPKAMREMGFGS
jgi:hypothetical protein